MANFAVLTAALKMNMVHFADGLRDAAKMTNKFANDVSGKVNNGLVEPAKRAKVEYKDVARIVQGIMISKVFYSGLGAIRNATNAVWEFSKSLEYANIAYANLFGSTELATEFINVLEDFAAKTPFSFSDAEAASKRLLAYGVEYKNVMYMMQGIMAASAMQGNPEVIERVSRSMGQIYTKGRLMNEEMRQLAEAGIPAYQILREELGLTQEQLQNLGDEAIPASVAINALIEGMNKRFSGVVSASAMTMTGLISNIKDNALMIAQTLTAPLYDATKEALAIIYNFMAEARVALDTKGIGGLFEFVVPESLRPTIKAFIANIMNLYTAIKPVAQSMWELSKAILLGVVQAFNIITPILVPIISLLTNITYAIASNKYAMSALAGLLIACASAWAIFKIQAMGALIITAVTTAIRGCARMVMFLSYALLVNPIGAILAGIAAALIFVAISSKQAGDALQLLFSKITAFAGVDPDTLLLPSQEERAADIGKFNEALDGTADSMDNLADKTAKANKSLLSFDEVFKLNDVDEGADGIESGITVPEIPDIAMPGIEQPDLNKPVQTWVDSFIDSLKKALEGKNLGEIIKTLFWDPIKNAFGLVDLQGAADVITAAFGGFLAGITNYMDDAFKAFKWGKIKIPWASMIDDSGKISLKAGFESLNVAVKEAIEALKWPKVKIPWSEILDGDDASLASIFKNLGSKITGGIKGLFSGASIKASMAEAKEIVRLMSKEVLENGFKDGFASIFKAISDALDAAIFGVFKNMEPLKVGLKSFLKGFIVGAIVDLTAGFFSNLWVAKIKEIFNLNEDDLKNAGIGQTIGGILGGIIGSFFGPLGSIVGIAVGDFVGSILGVFWTRTVAELSSLKDKWVGIWSNSLNFGDGRSLGEKILTFLASAFSWVIIPFQLMWTALFKPLLDGIGSLFGVDVSGAIEGFFSNTAATISGWISTTWTSFQTWQTNVGTTIGTFIGTTLAGIGQWCTDGLTAFNNWQIGVGTAIGTFIGTTIASIAQWCSDTFLSFTTWIMNVILGFTTFFTNVGLGFTTFFTNVFLGVTTFLTNALTSITTWLITTATNFNTWFTTNATGFMTFFTNIFTNLTTFFTNALTSLTTWCSTTATNLVTWFANNASGFTSFFSNIIGQLGGWIANTIGAIVGWAGSTLGAFSGWFGSVIGGFAGWVGGVIGQISSFAGNTYGALASWVNSVYSMFAGWWSSVINGFYNFGAGIYNAIAGWIGQAANLISGLIDTAKSAVSAISSVFSSSSSYSATSSNGSSAGLGHAKGGVFNKEHVASFAEGNKAEAIIPLENNSAMQPFVDAVSNGLLATLAPMVSNAGGNSQSSLQPLYVGTLIADEKGLKELNRKMQVIQLQEDVRRG